MTSIKNRLKPFGLVFALIVLVFVSLIVINEPKKAEANHACPHNVGFQLYGRDENCGYFLNSYVDSTGSGLLTGIPDQGGTDAFLGVNNVDSFIAVMRYHLQVGNGCNPDGSANSGRRRNAAAFIVLTMQGAPAGTVANGPCVTSYSFSRWENLVRQYAARGLINFNENHTYQFNTRIQRSTMDVAWYGQAWDTRASIVVRAPDGSVIYAIKKDCANPVGRPGVLTSLDQPLAITCGSATPATVEVGEPFTLNVNFTTSGGTGPTAFYTIWVYNFTEANVPHGAVAAFASPIARSGGTGTGTIPNVTTTGTPVINSPGVHSGMFRVSVTDATNSPRDCPFTVRAVARPYHKVYGGDVSAGAAFGDPCFDTGSRIIGYNKSNFAYFGLSYGAGTQIAAFALNAISEFGSGQIRNNASPATNDMKNLTFANTTAGYGGSLGAANLSCAQDYWEGATGILSGNQTIGGRNLANGARQTIYVDGDVYVSGSITYTGGSLSGNYNSIDSIPSFRLIVRGNIYIAPGVSQLNGLYVAIPTNATDGRIYTCGINAAGTFRPPNLTEMNGVCKTNLTVYGAVVADLIKFTRSAGSLTQANGSERFNSGGNPAEKFIYTPEVWLTSDFNRGEDLSSIWTMPPVL